MRKKLIVAMLGCALSLSMCFSMAYAEESSEVETENKETEVETEVETEAQTEVEAYPTVVQANDVVWQIPAGYTKDEAQSTDEMYVYRNDDKTVCILVRVKSYNDANPKLALADIGSLTLSFTTQNDFSLISSETKKVDGAKCEVDKFQCGDAYYTIYSFTSDAGCYDFVYSGLEEENQDFADTISTINIVKDGEAAEPILPEPEEEDGEVKNGKVDGSYFKGKDLNSIDLKSEESVKAVQNALNALGYDCGTPDGKVGQKTRDAYQRFEQENGINVTSEIGPELVRTLFNIKE